MPTPAATAIPGTMVPTEGYQADKIVQYRIDASVDVDTHKALTRAADSWNVGFAIEFPGEDVPFVCERTGGARDPHELTRCSNVVPDTAPDDGATLIVKVVTLEQAEDLPGCGKMTLACVYPSGDEGEAIGDQTLYILENPVIPSKYLATLGERETGAWTNDPYQHNKPNIDGQRQIYLPGILKHEIGHPLGYADISGDENEDLWPDRLMNASTEQLEAPILTVEDIEVGTTQDYYDDLESQGKLLE